MRVLITGGFGFAGGRIAQHLQRVGHQAILGSRNPTRVPEWLPTAEVAHTDWNDNFVLDQICSGVDVVIQAAGMNAQDCASDPVAALAFNGLATARLIAAARRKGVKKFIYLSTAHVYANALNGTLTENICPRNLHPYATSHIAGENVTLNFGHCDQSVGVVLRLSNAFGAPVHKDVNCWMLLVNDLCRQAVTERSIILRSAGLQRRDFVTLEDVSKAVCHVISLQKEQVGDGVFNIGGAWTPRVIDMAELIQGRCSVVLGFTPEIIRPESNQAEESLDLDFRIDKLIASDFELSGNVSAEIDATLLLCHEAFGGIQ